MPDERKKNNSEQKNHQIVAFAASELSVNDNRKKRTKKNHALTLALTCVVLCALAWSRVRQSKYKKNVRHQCHIWPTCARCDPEKCHGHICVPTFC